MHSARSRALACIAPFHVLSSVLSVSIALLCSQQMFCLVSVATFLRHCRKIMIFCTYGRLTRKLPRPLVSGCSDWILSQHWSSRSIAAYTSCGPGSALFLRRTAHSEPGVTCTAATLCQVDNWDCLFQFLLVYMIACPCIPFGVLSVLVPPFSTTLSSLPKETIFHCSTFS